MRSRAVVKKAAMARLSSNARHTPPRPRVSQDMPFRVLQHDWRFWVSILGGFSLFTAALEGFSYSF